MSQVLIPHISRALNISEKQVFSTVKLLDEGATIPFISRYRKEATGSLDEVEVAAINTELKKLQELQKRKESILKTIEEQEKLTPELEAKINGCWDSITLEDLYLPYKPKRKTRASAAREKGLEPLAKIIMAQRETDMEFRAQSFLNNAVPSVEEALAGARDIIAEWINETAIAREKIRRLFEKTALFSAKVIEKKKEEADNYRDYFDYSESLQKSPSHRVLAILRAESEGLLRVSISVEEEWALEQLERIFVKANNEAADQMVLAVKDAFKRLMSPSLETEFKNLAKEKADKEAIAVFAENLRQLLMAPPLGEKNILAIDPGFRTGCKVACLDKQGNFIYHTAIYPHPPQQETTRAGETIKNLLSKYGIKAIAIGNGTAGRETERFIKALLPKENAPEVFMVNEAGASIYSASEAAREEFADLDLTVRGAISIGRRLLDPLAELVKIDPKSIGVGQYQHDVNQELLRESLDAVVSSVVNNVGVNLNTASWHLLRYVSGIGPQLAKKIISHRKEKGAFPSRKALLEVSGLGAKAFEQSAGFLRIPGAKNPLDNSAVHPERYALVAKMAKDLSVPVEKLITDSEIRKQIKIEAYANQEVGLPTLKDILKELAKPGLDPRGEAETFSFSDVSDISQLRKGMKLPGLVTNIAKFGAFVDIGIKENGLVHISQITNRFIKDPAEVLKLNQKVMVTILDVDIERKRVQLTMKE